MINFLRISKDIKLGDYLHSNGIVDNIVSRDIIGVCVIPSNFLPDNKARFISMAAMDPMNKEHGNYAEELDMVWYYDRGNFGCDLLVQRDKIPRDTNSDGIVEGYDFWGYLPVLDNSNSGLMTTNPQDLGTKYYHRPFNRIPSPYALDGSFNPSFHYRGSEEDYNEWALTDYRGDLNTREIVYSKEPGEKHCPAFYCCERFSPGYRDHEWYLPAIGELAFIPPRLEIIRDKMWDAINAGSPGVMLSVNHCHYWSSSECDHGESWIVNLGSGGVVSNYKDYNNYVRAFLAI